MRTSLCLLLIGGGLLAPSRADSTSAETRLTSLQTALDNINSKAGISLGGQFDAEYFSSDLGGPSRAKEQRSTETNEYTSVDFDIKARPMSAIAGRLIFRMHQNWQNFFSDIANPIFSRWISIDGTVKSVVSYHAGNFRLKYSPLTLWSPDIDVMCEPEIFAQMRQRAVDERFLGDNDRILQGATVGFDAEVVPLFNELHANVMGVRLRSIETSIANGSLVSSLIDKSDIEKYALGVNGDALFLKGVSLGATCLSIFDNKDSYRGNDSTADTLAQKTLILAIRPGIDIGRLTGSEGWDVRLSAEAGMSRDDSLWWAARAPDTLPKLSETVITGNALRAGIAGSGTLAGAVSLRGSIDYIDNGRFYRNELAQSPSFIGARIMNTENDTAMVYDVHSYHYSTFDALYNSVFKFAPTAGTNLWDKAPFQKNAYANAIFTQAELARLLPQMDPAVQLVMPLGPATPNRAGVRGDVAATLLNGKLEVRAIASSLSEKEGLLDLAPLDSARDTAVLFPATQFAQVGGGVKLEVVPRLSMSGSLVHSRAANDGVGAYAGSRWSITSDFVNAGLSYQFFKRARLLGGFQQIVSSSLRRGITATQTQRHYAGGAEYKVAEGAFVTGSIGAVAVANTSDAATAPGDPGLSRLDFHQTQLGLLLRVKF